MKKIIIVSIIFLLFISLFFSCELGLSETKTYNAIDATNALAKLAPVFAEVIRDNPEFIGLIKDEANKKFDGDTDVLFDNIKNLSVTKGGKTLKDLLDSKLTTRGEGESIDQIIAKIPYFNVYVFTPEEKAPNKNVDENIIVCANRYDVDDMDPNYIITGYDMTGNLYTFEKGEEPDRTSLVLGINEFLAYKDFLEYLKANGYDNYMQTPDLSLTNKGGWDQNTTHDYYLAQLYLEDDYENFPNGNAEVYCLFIYAKNGLSYGYKYDPYNSVMSNVVSEKRLYTLNLHLGTLINEIYQSKFALYFREWDIFWFWENKQTPDDVNAHLTIDTIIPAYPVAKSFGCNRWDDDLRYDYEPGTNNGHIYEMPECIELDTRKFKFNGFKVNFWDINGLYYYFGMPNSTSSWKNYATINYLSY
ncbi:MAG: hypothetical protein WH035_07520 [Spirochaetota bacterium]